MHKYLLLLFIFYKSFNVTAQERSVDELLWDAQYTEAINLINHKLDNERNQNAFILLNKKAEALIKLGNFKEADKLLQDLKVKSRQQSEVLYIAITESNLGLLYLHQGRNDSALEALQSANEMFQKSKKESGLESAQALSYLGILYSTTGKYNQAEEQLTMALNQRLRILDEAHELIAASYNDLGLVYSATNEEKALNYYEKAYAIYAKLHGLNHPKIALANTNLGYIYNKLNLHDDAVSKFKSALTIWNSTYKQPHPNKAFVHFNLGQTFQRSKDYNKAHSYFDSALNIYKETYGARHPEIARVYNAMGLLAIELQRYDEALNNYQKAIQANVHNFSSNNIFINPILHAYYDGTVLLYSLLYKAEALELRHYNKTLRFKDLGYSLKTLQVCDSLLENIRQQTVNENDKLTLGNVGDEVYEAGVRIAVEAAEVSLNKNHFNQLAFYFAEKSKSAVLLESISDIQAKSYSGIPAALLDEERSIKIDIATSLQKLTQKPSAEEEKHIRENYFSLNRSYLALVKKMEVEYPAYFNLKYNTKAPSIKQLQEKLDDQTCVLSYFTDDKNAKLYVFIITKKDYKIITHGLPTDFNKYITGLRNSLFFNDIKTYWRTTSALSPLLVPAKIPKHITDLIIIPTDRMSIIPFETLLSNKIKPISSYRDAPYLILRFNLRYEFSAGLILQKADVVLSKDPSIFLCAPVNFASHEGLDPLPASELEVRDIKQLFDNHKYQASLHTFDKAAEALVKDEGIKEYSFIHLATHGIVDELDPSLSRLFLTPSGNQEDGRLYAGEIYNIELNARLVTLSACQTGLGKISKSEGVIGLSRALFYAGTKSSMVSFWNVADQSTATLMIDFYKEALDKESSLSECLRKAKLNLIRSKDYNAPFYWAPFILIGF